MTTDDQYAPEALRGRLKRVRARIDEAVERRGEGAAVTLVAVTKGHPPEAIEVLYDAGVRHFGASYVQEWQDKVEAVPDDVKWHFVGRLQSNKAKYIADRVAMVHSADRNSVLKKLDRRSQSAMDVLLQVNPAMEPSKGGVALDDLEDLMDLAARYSGLRVRGLMGMPPFSDNPEDSRPYFRKMRRALEQLQDYVDEHYPGRRADLEHLSMGMTNDYEVAIEEGATIVRVGTALFGPRPDY